MDGQGHDPRGRRETKNRLMLLLRDVPRELVRGEESHPGTYLRSAIARKPERNMQVDAAIERLMDEASASFREKDGQPIDLHQATELLEQYTKAYEASREHRHAPKPSPERTAYEAAKADLRDLQKQVVNAVEARRLQIAAEKPSAEQGRTR